MLMRALRFLNLGILAVLVGSTALVYAQDEKQQEEKPAHQEEAKPQPKQEAKPSRPEEGKPAQDKQMEKQDQKRGQEQSGTKLSRKDKSIQRCRATMQSRPRNI